MATGTPPRQPLTRDRVLRAAVALADAGGLSQLSMRKVAADLGFEVMSLYNHVANKDDLIGGMLELVAAEVDLPDPTEVHWKRALRQVAVDQHQLLLRHRWAGSVALEHFPGPHRKAAMEVILQLLANAGFDDDLRDVGYHSITLHVAGFAAQHIAYDFDESRAAAMIARADAEFRPESYPRFAEHLRYHVAPSTTRHDRPSEFLFVLDLILDGLERTASDHLGHTTPGPTHDEGLTP